MKCKMERCETWGHQVQSLNETFILGALNMVKISSAYRSKFSDRRYKVTMDTYGLTPWLVTLVIQGILGGISYELRAPLHTGDLREDYLWVESCPIYRVSKGGLPMSWERGDYLWVERGRITYELREGGLPMSWELPHIKGRNWKSSKLQTPWLPAGSIL